MLARRSSQATSLPPFSADLAGLAGARPAAPGGPFAPTSSMPAAASAVSRLARVASIAALAAVPALAACTKDSPSTTGGATSASTATPTAAPAASSAPPAASAAPAPLHATDTFTTSKGDLRVTPIHHATMLLEIGGKAIYLDPVGKDANYAGLPKADYVFITDVHGDHLDDAGIAAVKKDGTVLVGPPAVNAKTPMTVVLKNGESKDFPDLRAEAVPMYNLVRGPDAGVVFHDKGRGDGYVLTFGDKRIYVSGDTECVPEIRALKKIDVAFICMNLPYTMPPSEAAECVKAFKPAVVFPYHHRGSNLAEFQKPVEDAHASEVRVRPWY